MRERRVVVFAAVVLASVEVAGGVARAQEPKSEPSTRTATATVADPGARFRFIERYAVEPDKAKPGVLTQYQVAVLETIKGTTEKPQGAPSRSEISFRTIYTERPARVGQGSGGEVLDAIRQYESFRPVPDRSRSDDVRPLEGLTLWYHPRVRNEPQVLSLTERELKQMEYLYVSRHVFLPDLRALLPTLPSPVGDSWPVPIAAAQALLCDPSARGRLVAKLADVHETKGARPEWVAVITISGRMLLAMTGDTAVNAELEFRFPPPVAGDAAAKKDKADQSTVEARGAVTELRIALAASSPVSPDPKERLRHITTRELILQRRPASDGATLLRIPNAPPTPTEANSWLTFATPAAPNTPRFFFRHPQELLPPPGPPLSPGRIDLLDRWPVPNDEMSLNLVAKTGKPEEDRRNRDPEFHRKNMLADWERERLDVVQGPHGWLPEADWAPLNMKVYRVQAALKETKPESRNLPRTYLDFYLVLFGRDECLALTATTTQDPPAAFRKQTEAVLKTFHFDAPKETPKADARGAVRAPRPTP